MNKYILTVIKVLSLSYILFYLVLNDLYASVILSTVLFIIFIVCSVPSWKLEEIIKKGRLALEEEEEGLIQLREANDTLKQMKVFIVNLKREHTERSKLLIDRQATLEQLQGDRERQANKVAILEAGVVDLEAQNNKLRTQVQEQLTLIKDLSEKAKEGEAIINKVRIDNLKRALSQTPKTNTEKLHSIKRQMKECGIDEVGFNKLLEK